jgi:hypothetical protein
MATNVLPFPPAVPAPGGDAIPFPGAKRAAAPGDYSPLAAAHRQLGNRGEAPKWYEKGAACTAANKHPHAAELPVLRADAEALLGIQPASRRGAT